MLCPACTHLRLDVKFRRHRILDKCVVNIMFLIIIWTKSFGVVMKLADARRSTTVKCREHDFVSYCVMAAQESGSDELRFISLRQRSEFIKTSHGRACGRYDVEISDSKTRLHGIDINRLQELSLKQLAYASDIMSLEPNIRVGKKTMGRVTAGIETQRFGGFHECALFETQVVVDSRQAGTSCRLISIQQQLG